MNSRHRPKGLIFDWGGVLTTPVTDTLDAWMERDAILPSSFQGAMKSMHNEDGSPLHRLEVGDISGPEFERALGEMLQTTTGSPIDSEGLLHRMFVDLGRNEPLRALVTEARGRGWRTAILSNAWGMEYDLIDLGKLADQILLSDRLHLRKPDPRSYLKAAEAIDVTPQDCVFVDDLRRNVRGAEAVGMRAFHYMPGTENDLRALLHLD